MQALIPHTFRADHQCCLNRLAEWGFKSGSGSFLQGQMHGQMASLNAIVSNGPRLCK